MTTAYSLSLLPLIPAEAGTQFLAASQRVVVSGLLGMVRGPWVELGPRFRGDERELRA